MWPLQHVSEKPAERTSDTPWSTQTRVVSCSNRPLDFRRERMVNHCRLLVRLLELSQLPDSQSKLVLLSSPSRTSLLVMAYQIHFTMKTGHNSHLENSRTLQQPGSLITTHHPYIIPSPIGREKMPSSQPRDYSPRQRQVVKIHI